MSLRKMWLHLGGNRRLDLDACHGWRPSPQHFSPCSATNTPPCPYAHLHLSKLDVHYPRQSYPRDGHLMPKTESSWRQLFLDMVGLSIAAWASSQHDISWTDFQRRNYCRTQNAIPPATKLVRVEQETTLENPYECGGWNAPEKQFTSYIRFFFLEVSPYQIFLIVKSYSAETSRCLTVARQCPTLNVFFQSKTRSHPRTQLCHHQQQPYKRIQKKEQVWTNVTADLTSMLQLLFIES